MTKKLKLVLFFILILAGNCFGGEGLPLFYWQDPNFVNFGDYISLKIVERIVGKPVQVCKYRSIKVKKLLAVGSILYFANEGDVIWGSGVHHKHPLKSDYNFKNLDVRAVRGPVTRDFLIKTFQIDCPEVYGDPGLLFPYFFPEFKKSPTPKYDYIIIPHYSEKHLFPRTKSGNVVYPTDPWDQVIKKILDSKFVISSSLHGIVIAEAYGIPARFLRVSDHEGLLKYKDYYSGTNRPHFEYATSIDEALQMGGEPPFECDLEKLYDAFPFDYWQKLSVKKPSFLQINEY